MPATSRHGESGSTRSASGLAGSPSKSTIFQPFDGAQCLAEVEVAVHPLDGATGRARRRARTAAQAVGVRRQLRHDVERGVEPASHRVGERGGSSAARSARSGSARRGRRAPRRAPRRAARPRRRSRRRPRRRAGRPRRTGCARWRARGPSRRWRCAGTAGASRAGRLARCRPRADELEPAVERRDVVATRPGSAPRGSRCRGSRPG